MSVLVIGDLRIPYLSPGIPREFEDILDSKSISRVFCTGNLCTWKVLKQLQNMADDVCVVRGRGDDYEFFARKYMMIPPTTRIVNYKGYRIGLVSDLSLSPTYDPLTLSLIANSLSADVLFFGGSPTFQSFTYDGCIFMSPGSATGAFAPPIFPSDEILQESPLCKCVDVVDNPDKTSPKAQEVISTYKFSTHPRLYAPTLILLDFGTQENYGKVDAHVYILLDNKLQTETLNLTINLAS